MCLYDFGNLRTTLSYIDSVVYCISFITAGTNGLVFGTMFSHHFYLPNSDLESCGGKFNKCLATYCD